MANTNYSISDLMRQHAACDDSETEETQIDDTEGSSDEPAEDVSSEAPARSPVPVPAIQVSASCPGLYAGRHCFVPALLEKRAYTVHLRLIDSSCVSVDFSDFPRYRAPYSKIIACKFPLIVTMFTGLSAHRLHDRGAVAVSVEPDCAKYVLDVAVTPTDEHSSRPVVYVALTQPMRYFAGCLPP